MSRSRNLPEIGVRVLLRISERFLAEIAGGEPLFADAMTKDLNGPRVFGIVLATPALIWLYLCCDPYENTIFGALLSGIR